MLVSLWSMPGAALATKVENEQILDEERVSQYPDRLTDEVFWRFIENRYRPYVYYDFD